MSPLESLSPAGPQLRYAIRPTRKVERDALLALDYRGGVSAKDLGKKYGIHPTYACVIARKIVGARKAPRDGRRQNRLSLYFSAKEIFYIRQAAKARGTTAGSLVSRLARICADDVSLFDNILDDGVETPRGQQ